MVDFEPRRRTSVSLTPADRAVLKAVTKRLAVELGFNPTRQQVADWCLNLLDEALFQQPTTNLPKPLGRHRDKLWKMSNFSFTPSQEKVIESAGDRLSALFDDLSLVQMSSILSYAFRLAAKRLHIPVQRAAAEEIRDTAVSDVLNMVLGGDVSDEAED